MMPSVPPLFPIHDPHREPDAERGEGDGRDGKDDGHQVRILTPPNATQKPAIPSITAGKSHSTGTLQTSQPTSTVAISPHEARIQIGTGFDSSMPAFYPRW